VLGVAALGRRIGLERHEAAFGALLFLTLPIVVLQASTTQNDLVVAAMLVAATVFVLGSSRAELGLAALAVALAIGTKVTALYALPILAALVLVAAPRARRLHALGAVVVGAIAGSWWYVVNLAETGKLLGERPDTGIVTVGELKENLLAAFARVLDAFDLSGSESADRFVVPDLLDSDLFAYVVAAIVLGVTLLVVAAIRRSSPSLALAAGALALLPLAVAPVGYALWRVFAKLHDVLGGETEALPAGEWPPQITASESLSWFGPLGLILVVGCGGAAVVLHRRGRLPAAALVLASAPLVWLALVSLSITYDVWQGRFFAYPVALSAALWGLVLRLRPAAWAAVAVGATTVTLALVNSLEKPSGVELFADRDTPSIWGMERWEQQSLGRPSVAPVLRFLEERVPEDASIALALGEDDFGYPAFGPRLERKVVLASGSDVPTAEWLLASPLGADVDPTCWRARLDSAGGSVFERAPECRAPG
jgi:Glycosyltransferase family 87